MAMLLRVASAAFCLLFVAGCVDEPSPTTGAAALAGSRAGACTFQAPENDDNEVAGTLLGIGLGALGGSMLGTTSGVLAGAIVGGWIGGEIGADLDETEAARQEELVCSAITTPNKGAANWRLDDRRSSGAVKPIKSYSQSGKQCATIQQTVVKNGKTYSKTGSYCRDTNGSVTKVN
jgi:surface antigen